MENIQLNKNYKFLNVANGIANAAERRFTFSSPGCNMQILQIVKNAIINVN